MNMEKDVKKKRLGLIIIGASGKNLA